MTCKDYLVSKFGKEKAEEFVSEFCPSTFGFIDGITGCGEEHGCSECWKTVQPEPVNFQKRCDMLLKDGSINIKEDEVVEEDDRVSMKEAVENMQNAVCEALGIPESVLENPDVKKQADIHRASIEEAASNIPRILDSGDRTEFESGAVRDMRVGKGRCDLLPLDVVRDMYHYYYMEKESEIFAHIVGFITTGHVDALYEVLRQSNIFVDPQTMLLEVAIHFEEGAKKYGDNNWRKGIPVRCYIDSAIRHYLKWLRGDKDEPHDRAFCWNILCAIWTCNHLPELNDYRCDTEVK